MTYIIVLTPLLGARPSGNRYSIYRLVNANSLVSSSTYVSSLLLLVHGAYYSTLSRLYYYTTTYQEHSDVFTLSSSDRESPINRSSIVFSGKWENLPNAIQVQMVIDTL